MTLTTLANAIFALSGIQYAWTEIAPVDDQDGGVPGGNIRVAYFYKPNLVRLRNPNPGNSTTPNIVLPGPELKYNPGRIDPLNPAFTASRKPLAAAWETLDGKNKFFTVNVHFGSKGGGSPIEGDARPPVNGGVEDRIAQMKTTGVGISPFFHSSFLMYRRNSSPRSSPKTQMLASSHQEISTNSVSLLQSKPSNPLLGSWNSMMWLALIS